MEAEMKDRVLLLKEIEEQIKYVKDEVEHWERKYEESKKEYMYQLKRLEALRIMYNNVEQLKLFD